METPSSATTACTTAGPFVEISSRSSHSPVFRDFNDTGD
jgi:hypothetical protein